MAKCHKVKNPCKICLGPVTHKNGLQCHGACESWVHYSCLNYTPGRVKDIKAGVINVTCPCPDCKTTLPKEYTKDENFSCTNIKCPANNPPQCVNTRCPVNAVKPEMNQTSPYEAHNLGYGTQYPDFAVPNAYNAQDPYPLKKCGESCKDHSNHYQNRAPIPLLPNNTDGCGNFSPCSSGANVSGDTRMTNPQQIYQNTNNFPSLQTMEEMCNTIGLLNTQLNNMMMQMRNASNSKPGCCPANHGNCSQPGPKSQCQKPCCCPENPGTKKYRTK